MNLIEKLAEASGKDVTTLYRYIRELEKTEIYQSIIVQKTITQLMEETLLDALEQIPEICALNNSKNKKPELVLCPNLH